MNKYIEIIKPRIILSNLISMCGGFFLSSKDKFDLLLFFFIFLGFFFVLISGCIFNNIIDRDIDSFMRRTKNRILVKNKILYKQAIVYAIAFLIIGLFILFFFVNFLSFLVSLFGIFIYVVLYSLYFKRNSIYSTIIGGISGSIPPFFGYCSVKNSFDFCSFILFLIFLCWQISHFYSISIIYNKDYYNIKLPIFIFIKGINKTKINIIIHICLFFISNLLLYYNNFVSYNFILIIFFCSFIWFLISCLSLFFSNSIFFYEKVNFYFSIFIIFIFSVLISFDFNFL
ncbi:heme o synthase [Buchnera aphidicola]|uniref:heme o synthase n=1 Tax=Buchnera aphidicola TaxID=9 RepID=UPI0031B84BBF